MTTDTRASSIVIVRHGETDWNIGRRIQGRTDIALNERGRAQAGEIAELLHGEGPWRRVITSPLGRAAETARIIADRLALPPAEVVADVIERDFGSAEGMLVADANAQWPGLDVPDAEGLSALAERGSAALERILRDAPGAIVVAHGALIRSALTALGGAPAPRILNGEAWLMEPAAGPHAGAGVGRFAIRRLGTPAEQHDF
ncbi:histidine phosphatase family protein [Leucobacter chromiiresistens]|uniref:Probable phosphoglycerate mutase n=1 Tax=Leucobacter chromiiresistens TaxID=1079994 RepID=A0A1H0Z8D4_9MICO|nr:histidine phosphatase family protein [Leucobacter chromiiresistens]SDQ23580.1 probable phosphoglycerate mutase [Leucobacter chromiiresistens]